MTNVPQKIDFSGQTITVGIDAHLKSWNISLYFGNQYLKSFNQPPSVDVLSNFLFTHYPGAAYECAYESGFCGYWIQRELIRRNISCIVVNAADVPQTDKGAKNKNDKNDSKRLANALQAGQLKGIFVPEPELEADRQLVRLNDKYNNDLTRTKNRIKGLLYQFGIEIPVQFQGTNWSGLFINWLRQVVCPSNSIRMVLDRQLFLVDTIRQQKLEVLRDIRNLLKKVDYSKTASHILTIPGIGPLTAAALITEVGNMNRFKSFEQFNSFIGFCPMQFSSGEMDHKGNITTRQHKRLRFMLIEAAWVAVRTDPAFTLCFNEWKIKIGAKRAIIKIGRKLSSRLRYVWLNEMDYVSGLLK